MLINEIARLTGLSKDGVRHYEAMGLIVSTPRQAGSRTYREYEPSVLETIEKIRGAQRLGFSLKEIGPLLKAYDESPPPTREQTAELLHARLALVRAKMAELGEVEAFILAKLEHYRETQG